MPLPCFTNSCTVDLSTDVDTGQLIADAHVVQFGDDYAADPDNPHHVGVANLAAYNSHEDLTGSPVEFERDVTNPFDCEAVCIYRQDFKITGEQRNPTGNGLVNGDPEFWYATILDDIDVAGADLVAGSLQPSSAGLRQHRHDVAGTWITGFFDNYQDDWFQEVQFKIESSGTVTVTHTLTVIQHHHFDLTATAVAPLDGNQGLSFRGALATFIATGTP